MIRQMIFMLLVLLSAAANAQETGPQMADVMRSDGKIYVVVAVLAAIFVCLVIFLVYLDRKVSRLERRVKNQNSTNP